jgi:signal transduction histidine kinase
LNVRTSDQRLRATVFVMAGGFFLFAMLLLTAVHEGKPAQWLSGVSGSVVLIATGLALRYTKGARVDFIMAAVGVFLVLGVPLLLWLDGARMQLASTVLAFPLALTVLFFDRFFVVLAVSAAGLVGNGLLALTLLEHQPVELLAYIVLMVGLYGVAVLAAWANHRSRVFEMQSEGERNQALRLSENRRAQSERLAIVGRLAAGVAHEINNPLAYVKANVATLHRELLDPRAAGFSPQELGEMLEETLEGVERIVEIVSDLKSIAREDKAEVEAVDLADVVRATLRLAHVRLSRKVHLEVAVPDGLPMVRANRRKLSQVLLNLLINASDVLEEHCNAKGTITLTASVLAGSIRIDVIDSGPGIAPEVLPRLFEPFFTTKAPGKGTGLGLALSREYAQSFGATLSATNVAMAGACFSLLLSTLNVTGENPVPEPRPSAPPLALSALAFGQPTAR